MCLICSSIDKNQLTLNEAWRNLHEMYETIEEDHVGELLEKMMTLELSSRQEEEIERAIPQEFMGATPPPEEPYPIPFDEWDEWNNWGSD